MKFSIKDLSSKYDQIRMILRIWSHLLNEILDKKFLKSFIFCAVHQAFFRGFNQIWTWNYVEGWVLTL